ncbi:MAG: hypothetical protein M1831_007474 [Alyxoria varia]|nr:MAG: hypothetical protein M1831_007474 [Alyxoria varia]
MAPALGNAVTWKRSSFEKQDIKYTSMLVPHTATFYKFPGQNTTTNEETVVWCLKSEFDKKHGPIQAIPAGGDIGGLNTEPDEDVEYEITIDHTWYNVSQYVGGGLPVFAIASPDTPSVMSIAITVAAQEQDPDHLSTVYRDDSGA